MDKLESFKQNYFKIKIKDQFYYTIITIMEDLYNLKNYMNLINLF